MRLATLLLAGLGTAIPAVAQDARRPGATVQQPIVVEPPLIEVPARPAPIPAAPSPPPAVTRPPVVTTCDAGGCWDSDGRRLNRAGPVLVGPGGACSTSGNAVQCP